MLERKFMMVLVYRKFTIKKNTSLEPMKLIY